MYANNHELISVFDDPHGPNYAFKSSQQLVPVDGYLSFAMSMWMHTSIATCLHSSDTPAPNSNDINSFAAIENPEINSQPQHRSSQESFSNQTATDIPRLSKDAIMPTHHDCTEIFNKVFKTVRQNKRCIANYRIYGIKE